MGASNNVDKARLENVWGIFTRGNAGADLTVIAFHRRGLAVLSRGQHCHLLDNECNSRKKEKHGVFLFPFNGYFLYQSSSSVQRVSWTSCAVENFSVTPQWFFSVKRRSEAPCYLAGQSVSTFQQRTVLVRLSRDAVSLDSATSDHRGVHTFFSCSHTNTQTHTQSRVTRPSESSPNQYMR